MSEEEYLFVELKARYMEYARLIQSQAIDYLPYRYALARRLYETIFGWTNLCT
jgi:hypothetical protein